MKRALVLIVLGAAVFGLTACSGATSRLQSELEERAERGLAVVIDYAMPRVQQILNTHNSIDEITASELVDAFVNDFTDLDMTDSAEIVFKDADRRAVYAVDEVGGTVRFHAFFYSAATGSAGFVSSSAHRYTCGTISGSFGSDALVIHDEECPPALQKWVDAPMDEISMVHIARSFDLEVGLPR